MSTEESEVKSDPPCRLLVRSKKTIEIFTCPERATDSIPKGSGTVLLKGSTTFQHVSPNGSFVFCHLPGHGIVKIDLKSNNNNTAVTKETPPFFFDTANVQLMALSPAGTYAVTWERLYDDKCPLNLKLWDCQTGKLLAAFAQKSLSSASWPYLQWTYNEQYAMLLVNNNQIRVYPASAFEAAEPRYVDHLQVKGCTSFSLPQTHSESVDVLSYYLTTFTPVTKDKPAAAVVHEYIPTAKQFKVIASKSLFQAEECSISWSPTNDAALLTLQTSVDASGQSYYGGAQIFLWNIKNSPDSIQAVPLFQEGAVQAVKWLPHPDKPISFVVIAGKMPAMASLHHGITGKPVFQFGNNVHRNTIAAAPHGRFLCLAGFGNLAGGMGFWDINKKKLLPHRQANVDGTLRAEAVTAYEWSPDSRLFVVATCSPRMNVDNGIKLFRYTGEEFSSDILPWDNSNYTPDQLLSVAFVNAADRNQYPDRPQTPPPERPAGESYAQKPAAGAKSAAGGGGRYVPPSARNRAGGNSLAERLRREKEGSVQGAAKLTGKNAKPTTAGAPINPLTGKPIPGLVADNNTGKSKSQLKREKQKLKKQQEEEEARKKKEIEEAAAAAASPAPAAPAAEQDPEKRARKLKKILKQIDELKSRDPSSLNDDQKAKVASEPDILSELKELKL